MAMIFSSPKNFKRGRLINNRYRPVDLMIGIGAVIITLGLELLYLVGMNGRDPWTAAVLVLPAAIGVTMLVPFKIYHNLMELGHLYLIYLGCRKRWIWEGVYKYDVLSKKEPDDKA